MPQVFTQVGNMVNIGTPDMYMPTKHYVLTMPIILKVCLQVTTLIALDIA